MPAQGEPPKSNLPERRRALVDEIAKEESNLRRLEAERADAIARLLALQTELAAVGSVPAPLPEQTILLGTGPRTAADKVKLFRELFQGRPDVYPTRFVSKKTGKAGYAPACSNKFVQGVCE